MQFQVRLLMFDLDGTLLNTAPQIAQAANQMLAALALPELPPSQITSYIGEGVQNLIKRCVTASLHAEPTSALWQRAEPLFQQFYSANVTESQPFAGAVLALQQLKTLGYRLACVSNKPKQFTEPLLQAAGLLEYFELVLSGDSLPKKKPDPLPLLHCCQRLGVLPSEAMMVGDSETDVAAARAAGCMVVTVPYGYNQGRTIDVESVDAMVAQLTDLVNSLRPPVYFKQG